VWATPGDYIVKLTAGGKSTTQPLTVKMDPRVKVTTGALQQQFQLASRIATSMGEVASSIHEVSVLGKQIDERKADAAKHAEIAGALDALRKKIDALQAPGHGRDFGVFGLTVPGDEPESLPGVASSLSGLLQVVESADAAPTSDARNASDKWLAAAQATLQRWSTLKKEDVARVNAALQNVKLKGLALEESPSTH
jgi:hypothetical protein